MHITQLKKPAALLAALFFIAARLAADVVETNNGARIVGTVTKIDGGVITMKTDFAGEISIQQKAVTAITTDGPISVRLASGTVLAGKLSTQEGALHISGTDGELTTKVEKVATTWAVGAEDPNVTALKKAGERHWTYEVALDVTGKTGNKEQVGTAVSAKAEMKTAQDTLGFYTAYDRQVADKVKSSDQFKAGVDYQNNFAGRTSWYVRDEGGFDRVKQIDVYDIAAAGLGYDFIKKTDHTLTARAGLSFRYEDYTNPALTNLKSTGADFALKHEWAFANSKLINEFDFVPAFDDFSNFRFTHQTSYELPVVAPFWKLRIGIENDYNSKPGPGIEKLDTTYFTRLVFSWQ
jgi:putative salt-induced outer membrane protein YdiY